MIPLTRSRLWFAAFVLVVFVMGLAAGIAIDRFTRFGPQPPPFARGPLAGRPPSAAGLVDRVGRDLDLTPEQRQQLEAVLRRNGERMRAFQSSTRQEFEAMRRQLDAEIEAILTPEQREKFDRRRVRRRRPLGREP